MQDLLDIASDPPAPPLALSFEDEPRSLQRGAVPVRRGPRPIGAAARAVSLALDGALVGSAFALVASAGLCREPYPLDALLREPGLWAGLLALVGMAYSFVFVALQGRTPGMAAARCELRTVVGDALSPLEALLRAVISAASTPALFGFVLAVFDRRGQTLHDKLCGCLVVAVD